MLACRSCERHVRDAERSCPFCGTHLRAPAAFPPVAALVVAVGSVLIGCGPAKTDSGDSASGSSTSADETTTASPTSSTASGTTPATATGTSTTGELTSTTDDTVGDTSSSDDSTDLVGGFYGVPGDFGETPFECDVFSQDCARDERCVPWANDGGVVPNATRCSPIDRSPAEVGETCTREGGAFSGIDSCNIDAICFPVDDETGEGTCVAFCGGTDVDPTCDAGQCVSAFSGVLPICLSACNPLAPDCGDGEACFLVEDAFQCVATGPEVAVGDPCDQLNDCAGGAQCIAADFFEACAGDNCCAELCDTEASACVDPLECSPVFEGETGPGVCAVPES